MSDKTPSLVARETWFKGEERVETIMAAICGVAANFMANNLLMMKSGAKFNSLAVLELVPLVMILGAGVCGIISLRKHVLRWLAHANYHEAVEARDDLGVARIKCREGGQPEPWKEPTFGAVYTEESFEADIQTETKKMSAFGRMTENFDSLAETYSKWRIRLLGLALDFIGNSRDWKILTQERAWTCNVS